jgi:hypothetical protein
MCDLYKLTEERLIGPGLHGVSERHNAEWLMNFISNPDQMLDNDPEVQALLKIWVERCRIRTLPVTRLANC